MGGGRLLRVRDGQAGLANAGDSRDFVDRIDRAALTKIHDTILQAARRERDERLRARVYSSGSFTLEPVVQVDTGLPTTEHDIDIDDARRLIQEGELPAARILLQRLQLARVWDRLTPHQKFRVTTNLAVSYQATDDRARVAELLEEGASYEPNTEKSAVNRVIALELRGKPEVAFATVLEVLHRFPESSAAVAARVRSAPSNTSWEQLLGWVAPEFEDDGAVGIALAMRALHLGQSEEATFWAARAIEFPDADSPSIAQARVIWSRATIHVALRDAWLDGGNISDAGRQRLQEAVDLLSRVIDSMSNCGAALAGEAYAHRSEAHEFLGDEAAAVRDAEEAGRLAPENPIVLLRLGEKHFVMREWDLAVRAARRAVELQIGPAASHLLARALRARNEPSDRSDAAEILVDLARIKELRRPDPAVREATHVGADFAEGTIPGVHGMKYIDHCPCRSLHRRGHSGFRLAGVAFSRPRMVGPFG